MKMPHPNDIGDIPLHRNSPFAVVNVSVSQMSPCRHYGRMNYRGCLYLYDPTTDTMWRDDVVKWWMKKRNAVSTHKNAANHQTIELQLFPLTLGTKQNAA